MFVIGNESGFSTPMARPICIEYEGAVYHVTLRGNDRRAIFRTDENREQFIELMLRGKTWGRALTIDSADKPHRRPISPSILAQN